MHYVECLSWLHLNWHLIDDFVSSTKFWYYVRKLASMVSRVPMAVSFESQYQWSGQETGRVHVRSRIVHTDGQCQNAPSFCNYSTSVGAARHVVSSARAMPHHSFNIKFLEISMAESVHIFKQSSKMQYSIYLSHKDERPKQKHFSHHKKSFLLA